LKKIVLYLFFLALILSAFFIKPIATYLLETSLTALLETPVKTIDFKLSSLDLYASIKEADNIAHVKINVLYPLQADLSFSGNINAFEVYHPLSAAGELVGTLYYKDHLIVNGHLLSMGADLNVSVIEEANNWEVQCDIEGLDLSRLEKENNLSERLLGLVDANITYNTDKNSIYKIRSTKIEAYEQEFNDLELSITDTHELIQAYALFKAPNIEYKGIWFNYDELKQSFDGKVDLSVKDVANDILLDLKGEHNETVVQANLALKVADSKVVAKHIVYDLNSSQTDFDVDIALRKMQNHVKINQLLGMNLQGAFDAKAKVHYENEKLLAQMHTQSLGGEFKAAYQDKKLSWKAKSLSLVKILSIIGAEQTVASSIDSEGLFDGQNLQASLHTPTLAIGSTQIKEIDIKAQGKLDEIKIMAYAQTPYADIQEANITLKDFSDLNLSALINTPYTQEVIQLNAQAEYEDAKAKLALQAHSNELNLNVYKTLYKDNELKGSYNTELAPSLSHLKDKLHLKGNFHYEKAFELSAKTKDFGGKISAELKGEKIAIKGKKIRLEKLFTQLSQPAYLKGKADVYVNGDIYKQSFSLYSKQLSFDKNETGLDENISCLIKGNLNEKRLYIQPDISNRYLDIKDAAISFALKEKKLLVSTPLEIKHKNENLKLKLDITSDMKDEVKAQVKLSHEKDFVVLQKLSYKKKRLKTDIDLQIKDLSPYAKLFDEKLYGPLDINANVKSQNDKAFVNLSTQSLGGELLLVLKDKDLRINLNEIESKKIGYLLKKSEGASKLGRINGYLEYNLKDKRGDVAIKAKEVRVQGIDIDKTLREYKDVLGLNIFAMGNSVMQTRLRRNRDTNLSTFIPHLEFNVDITPELISSKDVAVSTEKNRFALHANLRHNGEIKDFEVAILDLKGCAVLKQKLEGNIKDPQLVGTAGTAVVVLGQAPKQILNTGDKIISAGAGLIDSTASFLWQKGLRQDSKVTLIEDTYAKGTNIFSSGKDLVVPGECTVFYQGDVKAPQSQHKERK